MSQKKSDYPKTYRHPVTKQERNAANVSQEVNLKFDGYRLVEAKTEDAAETPSAEADKTETPKVTAPKPGPTPKAQENK